MIIKQFTCIIVFLTILFTISTTYHFYSTRYTVPRNIPYITLHVSINTASIPNQKI